MKQKIYEDSYGVDTWDLQSSHRVFVHLVNSQRWREITGEEAPTTPITAKEYERAGLPWYDLYDADMPSLSAQPALKNVKSIGEMDTEGVVDGNW